MASKKPEVYRDEEGNLMRPEEVAGTAICGRCIFYSALHPATMGPCKDTFSVTRTTRACVDFEIDVDPSYYRRISAVKKYNLLAGPYLEQLGDLIEEVQSLAGRVFSRAQTRAGNKRTMAPVLEVLRKHKDTSALIPFLEEVQRYRDRVSEIQSMAINWAGEIGVIREKAESYMYSKFSETRTVKPEAIRKATISSVLAELQEAHDRVDVLLKQCDAALRNFSAQHNALIEIQVSARTPVAIPKVALSELKADDSPILRGKSRNRNR